MSRQAHEKEFHDGRVRKPKPYEVRVQIPYGVHSKVSKKDLHEQLRQHLREVFRRLAIQKKSRIEEGHWMSDHVHRMIAIPPKYAVPQMFEYTKGKSAIHLVRVCGERKRNFMEKHFWACGYFSSTVARDEAMIRDYIRSQVDEDKRLDQMNP